MANLPVREMVLYKHGVGFFVRQGEVTGETVALTFRSDEINDVLKSLAVFDQAGGQVLGIHYQTPMDKAARLASSSIELSETASLRDLLRDLRGRTCDLLVETTPGSQQQITGRILGIDEVASEEYYSANVSVLTDTGVQILPYENLRSVTIQDDQSAQDLSYFLDTSMAEDDRRVVNVRLSDGEHDLAVYYVAPSPTWRVSYRLVADSDENGNTGKALLQGWGLFDNRLEEDLNNVRVTLVAGQPISFIYELYASRIPQRPTVEDESRIAPGPIEYDEAQSRIDDAMYSMSLSAPASPESSERNRGLRRKAASSGTVNKLIDKFQSLSAESAAVPTQAQGSDTGETFQYSVTTPVSVKRGESALVPIIGETVNYERELLYNGNKLKDHPVVALRFENNTGLTLERGPVTVVEDGDYKGEAVISFTKDQQQVYVPYAVELGIKVTESNTNKTVINGVHIKDKLLVEQTYFIYSTTYRINNTTRKPHTVTIESALNKDHELFETREPDATTDTEQRWHVEAPARPITDFTVKLRVAMSNRVNLRGMSYEKLYNYFKNNWLDEHSFNAIREILKSDERIKDLKKTISDLQSERETIYKRQEQLRANMGALQPTGDEAPLRNRLLGILESAQDRLEAIDTEIAESQQAITDTEAKIQEMLDALH